MSEAAVLCLLWLFSYGPNDYHLKTWLASADEIEQALLPLAELQAHWQPLWLVRHRRPDWPPVFALTASEQVEPDGLGSLGSFFFGSRRSLPGWRVPRLFIAASLWREGGMERGLRPLDEMALDDVEKIFRGYLSLFLERRVAAVPGLRQDLLERAFELMQEAPPDRRAGAYSGALVDFGAHMLSVAHEVGRHRRRKSRAELCAVLSHPATLFGFWQRAVTETEFPGWIPTATSGSPTAGRRSWRQTAAVLSTDDKLWFLQRILGTSWSGEPQRDFAVLCADPPAGRRARRGGVGASIRGSGR